VPRPANDVRQNRVLYLFSLRTFLAWVFVPSLHVAVLLCCCVVVLGIKRKSECLSVNASTYHQVLQEVSEVTNGGGREPVGSDTRLASVLLENTSILESLKNTEGRLRMSQVDKQSGGCSEEHGVFS
jgi:hypothetical protein